MDGVKVGFIGMTLEGTPELVAARGIEGLSFNDEVESANAAAAQLQQHNVEAIVVLLHEGGAQAGTFQDVRRHLRADRRHRREPLPAIDLVITGHTHQPYVCTIDDPAGNPRQVTSASSFGRVVTETSLTIDKKSRDVVRSLTSVTNHLVTRTTADPALTEIINKWKAIAAPIGNRVVGTITATITNPGNRQIETAMQNLVADGILAATQAPEDGGAQIALVNPGGVRAELVFDQIPAWRAAGRGHLWRGVRGAAVRQPPGVDGPHRSAGDRRARAAVLPAPAAGAAGARHLRRPHVRLEPERTGGVEGVRTSR